MKKEYRGNKLYIDNVSLKKLSDVYSTPLYIYSYQSIIDKINLLKRQFLDKYENVQASFATKSANMEAIIKIMGLNGLGVDVVSGGELFSAINVGFPPEKIEFNGNNKLDHEIELAIIYGIGTIIVDGTNEINRIENICQSKNKTANVMIRINPGIDPHTHKFISTGNADSKFGIPVNDEVLMPLVKQAIESEYINFKGLHLHLGSMLFDNAVYIKAANKLMQICQKIKDTFNYTIKELNLGGGFAVNYNSDDIVDFDYYLDPVMSIIQEYADKNNIPRPKVIIEPGRSMIAKEGMTLYRIGEVKEIPGIKTYASVDGGMSDNIRPALYNAQYRCEKVNIDPEAPLKEYTICGKCCESGDIVIENVTLPELKKGDLIIVYDTGAYGYTMANNYNKNPIPAVVLLNDGCDYEIVRRQTYTQMMQNEMVPNFLK